MAEIRTHDTFKHGEVTMGSERGFGIVFAVVFAIIGLWPLKGGGDARWWALGLAAVFLLAGLLAPAVLKPLNVLWFKLGLLLSKIMNPVIMGLIFFFAVLPTGLIMRLRGKDLLSTRLDKGTTSYWIRRNPPGPEPKSMRNQF